MLKSNQPQPEGGTHLSERSENLKRALQEGARKLARAPSEKAAQNILKLSAELSAQYELKLFAEFEQNFRANIEQELWKNCFYYAIESLRKQSDDAGPHSAVFKQYLLELIEQAITFYDALLKRYEQLFGVNFANYFRWPADGFPAQDLAECQVSNYDNPVHDTTVLRSAQRHMIYLGDLHRYKVQHRQLSDGAARKDYSAARRYYLQAHGLEPMNGHPFNQLAVLAYYSKTSVEMLFWYLRAISVRVPFEPARDSMEMALSNFRGPALNFEKWYWEQRENKENEMRKPNSKDEKTSNKGRGGPMINVIQQQNPRPRSKYIRHIWIRPMDEQQQKEKDKSEDEKDKEEEETSKQMEVLEEMFASENSQKAQKQAVQHLLNSAGILISNIGLEQFVRRSSELVLKELAAFLITDSALLTPLKLLQIVYIYAFPLHSTRAGASETLIGEQKRIAMSTILSIFQQFLELISADSDKIGLFLLTGKLSKKFSRAMPSLCFILNWIWALLSSSHHCSSDLRDIILFHNDQIWALLSRICNKLQKMGDTGELLPCSVEQSRQSGCTNVILPELVVVSPFFNILPKNPALICMNSPAPNENGNDLQFLAAHARFGLILCFCENLALDKSVPVLIKNDGGEFENIPSAKLNGQADDTQKEDRIGQVAGRSNGQEETTTWSSTRRTTTTTVDEQRDEDQEEEDESELKKKLLLDEQSSFEHRWIIEIRPKYLVPDTNTFIDHLDLVQLLVQSGLFTVLVPTIVFDELSCLTLGVPIAPGSSILLSRELLNPEGSRSHAVMQRAKAAVEWLREAAERRAANISTTTARGNILHKLTFAIEQQSGEELQSNKKRSNDDLILSGCINLCEKLERKRTAASSASSMEQQHDTTSSERAETETTIERTVVLLTEDRGLSAKAEAERIPVRTIPSFVRWALKGQKK